MVAYSALHYLEEAIEHLSFSKLMTYDTLNHSLHLTIDYGMLTILKTSEEGGLQVYVNGRWTDVCPPSDGFIINLGTFCLFLDIFLECLAKHHC